MAKQTFTTGQVLTAAQMTSLQQTAMLGGDAAVKTTSYVLVAADAGTSVAMNSTSATTVTVNTGLFAAGDTVTIINQNTGVCTVTAGTATVRKASGASLALSQYQGGVLDFISASEAIFFPFDVGGGSPLTTKGDLYVFSTSNDRLAIGTTNQVLTVDSSTGSGMKWAAPAGSTPSFSLLGTGTTTSGSTVTVSGISGVNTILVLINNISTNSNGSNILLRLNTDSGANYSRSGIYIYLEPTYSPSSQLGTVSATGQTSFFIGPMTSGISTSNFAGWVLIQGCNSTGLKTITAVGGSDLQTSWTAFSQYNQSGIYSGASTISSVSLVAGTGTFDQGTFTVYGSV